MRAISMHAFMYSGVCVGVFVSGFSLHSRVSHVAHASAACCAICGFGWNSALL